MRLEPANKTMKPIFRDNVEILGILVGVVREVLIGSRLNPAADPTLIGGWARASALY